MNETIKEPIKPIKGDYDRYIDSAGNGACLIYIGECLVYLAKSLQDYKPIIVNQPRRKMANDED